MGYPFIGGSPTGGPMPGSGPTMIVIHDIECPLAPGYASSLASWFASGEPGTSCHYIVDPHETVQMVAENVIAWHCGTGNTRTVGIEQTGYARYSRDEWLTDQGYMQHDRVGVLVAEIAARWGIPLRWLTDAADIRAAHYGDRSRGGVVTHDRIGDVLGGTDHWDPGYSYPHKVMMSAAGSIITIPLPEGDEFLSALSPEAQEEMRQQVYHNGGGIDDVKDMIGDLKAAVSWAHKRNMETQDPDTFIVATAGKPWRYIENGQVRPGGLTTEDADRLLGRGVPLVKVSAEKFAADLKFYGEEAA